MLYRNWFEKFVIVRDISTLIYNVKKYQPEGLILNTNRICMARTRIYRALLMV